MAVSTQISQLSKAVDDGRCVMQKLSWTLFTLADEFDKKQRKLDIAKVSLSSTGVAGTVMMVVGIALAPVTFGASLGLTIAGIVVGGAGTIGTISAIVAEKVISRESLEDAQILLNGFTKRRDEIQRQLEKLIGMLNAQDRVLAQTKIENCPLLTKVMKEKLMSMLKERPSGRETSQTRTVEAAVEHMISAAQILAQAGKAGNALYGMRSGVKAVAASVVRCIGTAAEIGAEAARAVEVAKASGIPLVLTGKVFDFVALIYFIEEIHKNEPSKVATKIREVAVCLV